MIRIALLPLAFAISGCAGSVLGDAIAGPEAIAEREDGYCRSIGLQFGTPEYANCRMMATQDRGQRHSAAIAGMQQGLSDMQANMRANQPVTMAPRTCTSMVNGSMVTTNCY